MGGPHPRGAHWYDDLHRAEIRGQTEYVFTTVRLDANLRPAVPAMMMRMCMCR